MAWIPMLETYEALMSKFLGYLSTALAGGVIKPIHYYGTMVKFIRMAVDEDIQKLSQIFRKHKHNFWNRLFDE